MDAANVFDISVDQFIQPQATMSSFVEPLDVSQILEMDCFDSQSEIESDHPLSFYICSPFPMLSPGDIWQDLVRCGAPYISHDDSEADFFVDQEQQLTDISPADIEQVPVVSRHSNEGDLNTAKTTGLDEVHLDTETISCSVTSTTTIEVAATNSSGSPLLTQTPQVSSPAQDSSGEFASREQADSSSKKRCRWQDEEEENAKMPDGEMVAAAVHTGKKSKMSPQSVLYESEQADEEEAEEGGEARVARRKSGRKVSGGSGGRGGRREATAVADRESRWAEQLLSTCAVAIANNNFVRTQHLMWVLNDLASLSGDANQRLAAHGLRALFARVTAKSPAELRPSSTPSGSPVSLHQSLLRFHHASPWHHLPHSIANFALLDALDGCSRLHVIDIGISLTTQWPTFIEALATRLSGIPSLLRLTVVSDPRQAGSDSSSSPSSFQQRLKPFARSLGLNLQLHNVSVALENLTPEDLNLQDGEALAICCQFRLHQVSDAPTRKSPQDQGTVYNNQTAQVELLSPRDALLQRLHGMNPVVLALSENDTDHSSEDFFPRFQEVLDFHWKFLDSTAVSFRGRDCEERTLIETESALVPMLNNLACEGEARVERNEVHGAWSERMRSAGFQPTQFKDPVVENAKSLLRKYDSNWEMEDEEQGCSLLLQWKGQPTTFCSIWKPAEER